MDPILNKNQIIDKIFKKLIIAKYEHADIKNFIAIHHEFASFAEYLIYLSIIGHGQYDDTTFKMANAIVDYADYLVHKFNLVKPNIDHLIAQTSLSNRELFLFGVKGYDGFLKFYFDDENNLYICLDHVKHEKYKHLINIAFIEHKLDLWLNKQNAKVLHNQFNKILIFTKQKENNIFLGVFKFLKISHLFHQHQQHLSFILIQEDEFENSTLLLEYENINHRNWEHSLATLKTKLQTIIMPLRTSTYKLLDIINQSTNHHLTFHSMVQHCLHSKSFDLLKELDEVLPLTAEQNLSINSLIPKKTLLNEHYLMLLSNSYDILYGAQIVSDYQHNIFMCLDGENAVNEHPENLQVRFIKSYNNKFFDLELNKKIFITTKTPTLIYLFQKQNQKQYLFLGYYKVSQIVVGHDLQLQTTPIFKLRLAAAEEVRANIVYNYRNDVSNAYKNAFIHLNQKLSSNHDLTWTNSTQTSEVKHAILTDAKTNSILYKYNWIIRKNLQEAQLNAQNKYWNAFITFDIKNSLNLLKTLQYDFNYLCSHQIMEPATIAYQMTKHNWSNPEIFKIAYMDYYLSRQQSYATCLAVINANDPHSNE